MKTKNLPLYLIATIIIVGFFALLGILIFQPVPEANRDMINLVIGALIGAFMAVVTYWYGSSNGSQQKTDLLAKADPINDDPKPEKSHPPVQPDPTEIPR